MAYRHELKYLINQGDLTLLRVRLSALMQRDRHANRDGWYHVRSLYFDDIYNTAYDEKNMGVLDRQKFRIRIYDHSDAVIHLERKIKWDRYVDKQMAPLTRDEAVDITRGDYDLLLFGENPLRKIFYYECQSNVMRPRCLIDYEREPFVFPAGNVRITLDQNIRVGMGRMDIFDDRMATVPLLPAGISILEVKYTEFIPELIRKILPPQAAEMVAASKYVLGCDQTIYSRISNY